MWVWKRGEYDSKRIAYATPGTALASEFFRATWQVMVVGKLDTKQLVFVGEIGTNI